MGETVYQSCTSSSPRNLQVIKLLYRNCPHPEFGSTRNLIETSWKTHMKTLIELLHRTRAAYPHGFKGAMRTKCKCQDERQHDVPTVNVHLWMLPGRSPRAIRGPSYP